MSEPANEEEITQEMFDQIFEEAKYRLTCLKQRKKQDNLFLLVGDKEAIAFFYEYHDLQLIAKGLDLKLPNLEGVVTETVKGDQGEEVLRISVSKQ